MARDADQAITEATSQTVRYGYYTPVVVLTDSDPSALEEQLRLLRKQLRNHGFGARLEDVNALDVMSHDVVQWLARVSEPASVR